MEAPRIHHYWHSEGVTDLAKMEEDARYRLTHTRWPERSIIHLHPYDPRCLADDIDRDPETHKFITEETVDHPEPDAS